MLLTNQNAEIVACILLRGKFAKFSGQIFAAKRSVENDQFCGNESDRFYTDLANVYK